MLIIYFDIKGIVHKEFVLAGQIVNSAYTYDVLMQTREEVWRLRPRNLATKKKLVVASRQRTITHFIFQGEVGVIRSRTEATEFSLCLIRSSMLSVRPPNIVNRSKFKCMSLACWN
jgi:hypothetical protein